MALELQHRRWCKSLCCFYCHLALQQHFFWARIWIIRIRDAHFLLESTHKIHLTWLEIELTWQQDSEKGFSGKRSVWPVWLVPKSTSLTLDVTHKMGKYSNQMRWQRNSYPLINFELVGFLPFVKRPFSGIKRGDEGAGFQRMPFASKPAPQFPIFFSLLFQKIVFLPKRGVAWMLTRDFNSDFLIMSFL